MESSFSTYNYPRSIAIFAGLFVLLPNFPFSAEGWVCPSWGNAVRNRNHRYQGSFPSIGDGRSSRSHGTVLFYSSETEDGSNAQSHNNYTTPILERLRINGVSVSPKGFHVLLESTTARDRTAAEPTNVNSKQELNANANDGTNDDTSADPLSDTTNADADANANANANANTNTGTALLPLKMTNDPADAYAATSPESLTLCQLLSGVDMAGAILPPELLGKMVVCHIEDKLETLYEEDDDDDENDESEAASVFTPVLSPIEQKLWEFLQNQEALKREHQALASLQSSPVPPFRIQMPQITLDQLTLIPAPGNYEDNAETIHASKVSWLCRLECALPEWNERITVHVKPDLLASLAYNYDPESSPLFTCIALALRYKAPIVLEQEQHQQQQQQQQTFWSLSRDDLDRDFPQRTTLQSLRQQSSRVTENIERGFEIHKLTGALQIAMRLGDTRAAEKIRAKLDEYDSMDDLPTLGDGGGGSGDTKTDPNDPGDRLDDLENNILQ